MLPCLRRALRPALSLRAGTGLAAAGLGEHHAPAPRWPLEQRRALGTHPLNETVEPLNSPRGAKEFIYTLHPSERTCLLRELHKFESIAIAQGQVEVAPPTSAELKYVLLHNAIPFVGFGFLDNCIMIVAGTHIELSIGVVLGISTMAAAALGNLVSDLAGLGNYIGHPGFIKDAIHRTKIGASAIHRAKIGASTITDLLAGYVEALAYRLGMQIPDLSPKQADMWQTRVSSHAGKAIGVAIGCILGMFPLFFLNDDDEKKKAQKEAKEKTQPQPTLAPTESGKN